MASHNEASILDQVTGTELESEVPSHTQNDHLLVKVLSLEQILCRGRFRHPVSYRRVPSLSTVFTRTPQAKTSKRSVAGCLSMLKMGSPLA
jgi:hypothetical protein